MHRPLQRLLLGVWILSLSACGFALRGGDVISSQFSSIQLISQQPNSEFSRLLRRSLDVSDVAVDLVESIEPVAGQALLSIGDERVVSRPVTVNPRARAAQYEMRLSVEIALGRGDQILIEPETLFVERTYFEDIENISGNREEVEIIAAEMRRELVNQLMRRLQAAGG